VRLLESRNLRLFVESGTYLGDTVAYVAPHVDRVITVELETKLWQAARRRFASEPKVEVLHGDALEIVPGVLDGLEQPALVWLDGHFMGGVSTMQGKELEPAPSILRSLSGADLSVGTTLVVDDLRLFGQGDGFPTLDALVDSARGAFPAARLYAEVDSLVIEV
jgi:hypothetical protein